MLLIRGVWPKKSSGVKTDLTEQDLETAVARDQALAADGQAKGAMLRHGAMVGTTREWIVNVGLGRGDRYLIVSPFFHISGHKTGVLACRAGPGVRF
jgi:hypothetical protein